MGKVILAIVVIFMLGSLTILVCGGIGAYIIYRLEDKQPAVEQSQDDEQPAIEQDEQELPVPQAQELPVPQAQELPEELPLPQSSIGEPQLTDTTKPTTAEKLSSLINDAKERLKNHGVADYTATLTKRERINGVLNDYEQAEVKVRHAPFSVYIKFSHPSDIKGREVIYVQGQNNNKLIARRGGRALGQITVNVDITSEAAMARNRYPITYTGINNFLNSLISVGNSELSNPSIEQDLTIREIPNCKIDGKPTRLIELTHTTQKPQFTFYIERLYIDNELNLPVRSEAYDFPNGDEHPSLLEEYTYTNIKTNVGLTDNDFDPRNQAYGFGVLTGRR